MRVALVTGSSRGLGAAIALRLGRDGFAVAVNSLPGDEQAEDVAGSICAQGGVAAAFFADVTDEQQVAGLIAAIDGRFGPVDALVSTPPARSLRPW
jgi:3-oxoacyl-[acyl-carrier protein] reductase